MLPPMVTNYEVESTQFIWVFPLFLGPLGVDMQTHDSLITSFPSKCLIPSSLFFSLPSSFSLLPTLGASIFETTFRPMVLQGNCWFEYVWCEKEERPLTCRSWPGSHSSAMLFSYQKRTQNTKLGQGYSEIMIKWDKAWALLSTDENKITVLHTKYQTPPSCNKDELLLLLYQLQLQHDPHSSLSSLRRLTEIPNHRIVPTFGQNPI